MNLSVDMIFEKNTKNTVVYKSTAPNTAIETLYIKKDKLPATPPPKIHIRIVHDDL